MGSSSFGLQNIGTRVRFVIQSDKVHFSPMKRAPSTISTKLRPTSLCLYHRSSTEPGRRKGITVKFNQSLCHWLNLDYLLNSLLASTGLSAGLLVSGKPVDRELALLPISSKRDGWGCRNKLTVATSWIAKPPRKNTKVALR